MLLLDKLKCPGLLVEVMYLELACPANVLALALALAGPANVPPLPRVSLLHCSALLSGEFNWVGSTPCTALLLCPCTALCCAAVMSQQCHAGVSLCTLQGLLFPPPCSNKTLLPSTPLPCHLNSSKTLSGTGWMTIKFNEHKRINTMCIKATFQMDVHGGATSGLDWMDGSLGESTITMCMHHWTHVRGWNTIQFHGFEWNGTQHNIQHSNVFAPLNMCCTNKMQHNL